MLEKTCKTILYVAFVYLIIYICDYAFANSLPIRYPLLGILIAWGLSYKYRKKSIGGWLLFYYFLLNTSFLILTLVSIINNSTNIPINRDNHLIYLLYFISIVSIDICNILEFVLANMLLIVRFRTRRLVNYLRIVFVSLVVFFLLKLTVYIHYSPEPIEVTAYISLSWPIIWLLYFSKSERVKYVFIQNIWENKVNEHATKNQNYTIVKNKNIDIYRQNSRILIWSSLIMICLWCCLIQFFGDNYYTVLYNIIIPLPVLSFCLFASGMMFYSMSKGYSKRLGFFLSFLFYIGLIILNFLDDKVLDDKV